MPFIHLAQEPTPIPDAAVVEVVQQATEAIDAFSNLGVFLAVLLVITLLIIFFGSILLVVVWSNRNSNSISLTTQAQVIADKARENQELKDERRDERIQRQLNHDQFVLMIAALTARQTEGDAAVTASLSGSETHIITSVAGARDDIVEGLKEYRRFNIIILDMLLQDPPAGRSRIKRAMKAFAEGNVQGAQDVADEAEPIVPAIVDVGTAATDGGELPLASGE